MKATAPLLEAYRAAGATVGEIHGTTTGLVLAPGGRGLWLADLSALPKWLLIGPDAPAVLADADLLVPALMQAQAGNAGAFVACRAPRQYLVSAGDSALPPPSLREADCALRHDCADFVVGGGSGGSGIDDLLAEACTADLRPCPPAAFVPTLCFGVEAALMRHGAQAWRVLAAPADGEFLAAALLAAVRERHGALAGYRDFLGMPPDGTA